MHAFVTGATGFLGRHLAQQLTRQGWKVTALYRDKNRCFQPDIGEVIWKKGALGNIQSLRCAMPESVDAVFHLACDTSTWGLHQRRQYQTNVIGTQNLAKIALEKNAIRFIYTSSLAVYGFHDDAIDEHSEMRGIDCPVSYFRSKYLAEEIIREYIKKGLDSVILNPSAIIGPYDDHNWGKFFDCFEQGHVPGIPLGKKSFCYVEDVAMAHVQAFIHGRCGENYILSGPTSDFESIYQWLSMQTNQPIKARVLPSWLIKSLGFIYTAFSHVSRQEPNLSLEEAYMLCANITAESDKAKRELQYRNRHSLEDMLSITLSWWQAHRQPSISRKNANKAA